MTGERDGQGSLRRVSLTGEKQTLLIPLYSRALDSRSSHPILNDRKADEIVRMIDFDFEKVRRQGNGNIMVVRARQHDEWVREFLGAAPNAVVLNLGCGLDTRFSRVAPPPAVAWFDVDFPDVIEVRRSFFSEGGSYRMLGSSITESGWLDETPPDRPAIAIADGVLEYLVEDDVRRLFGRLVDRFPRGQIIFDVMSSFAVSLGRERLKETMGAEHRWVVDDVRTVDRLDPRLRRLSNTSLLGSRYLPSSYRLAFGAATLVPRFRNMVRLLRYEFGEA